VTIGTPHNVIFYAITHQWHVADCAFQSSHYDAFS